MASLTNLLKPLGWSSDQVQQLSNIEKLKTTTKKKIKQKERKGKKKAIAKRYSVMHVRISTDTFQMGSLLIWHVLQLVVILVSHAHICISSTKYHIDILKTF